MRKIVKMFEKGNVSISGLVGTGKDMLMGNVVVRRKRPYVSNVDYGGDWFPLDLSIMNVNNTYDDFIKGTVKYYQYPYQDKTDIYISDCGVYFPAQYCNELNKKYPYLATFMALTRHLYNGSVHTNVQNYNRVYDKLREMSDQYITCKWCRVFFGKLVIQKVIIYERYQSAADRVPPFCLKRPLLNLDRMQLWEIQRNNYQIAHGAVKPRILIYWNKSSYNTRIFKEMLMNA